MVRDGILDKSKFDKYVTLNMHSMCFRWLLDIVKAMFRSIETDTYHELPNRVKDLEWVTGKIKKAVEILAAEEPSKSLELPGKPTEPTP
jgi:hypothetical protein